MSARQSGESRTELTTSSGAAFRAAWWASSPYGPAGPPVWPMSWPPLTPVRPVPVAVLVWRLPIPWGRLPVPKGRCPKGDAQREMPNGDAQGEMPKGRGEGGRVRGGGVEVGRKTRDGDGDGVGEPSKEFVVAKTVLKTPC